MTVVLVELELTTSRLRVRGLNDFTMEDPPHRIHRERQFEYKFCKKFFTHDSDLRIYQRINASKLSDEYEIRTMAFVDGLTYSEL